MHSNPEYFINKDGPEASYGPNKSPQTFPEILGKVRFYVPAPSQWTQAMWVSKWSHGAPGFQACGALVTPMNHSPWPTDHRTRQRPKGPKKTKTDKLAIVMARTQNNQDGPKWPKSKVLGQFSRTLETSPLLGG
ncbi:hypothetical protein O181_098323 [Austropuccinia psidii MF-1]|uniref:Uncharacterized protein n=1 Tax=Austropuccinia psidii MF-1 TaxID=1389203 RepID=A0A9Q3J917_9BASI|nr:hypothetical protein [Austropuccinia psidii MF-1]